jgi:ubiquinone/menaquinone biosynthesis C-methylase UbiE
MTVHAQPATTIMSMSARHWGALWSHRPRAWALSEQQHAPVYEQTLRHTGLKPGDRVLDLGCATGVFLRMCADRKAIVAGVDASAGLLALARTRVSGADLRVADLQTLPYPDDTFDLVTGFRSFFFAEDIIAALREARRVARPDAQVVIQVFGRPEHCDLEAVKEAAAQIGVAPPPDERERAHWRPIVEELAPRAGLAVEHSFEVTSRYAYADDTAVLDAMFAAVPGVAAIAGPEQGPELHVAILRALAHRRRPDGSYCISNRWHTVIARA